MINKRKLIWDLFIALFLAVFTVSCYRGTNCLEEKKIGTEGTSLRRSTEIQFVQLLFSFSVMISER